MIEQLEGVEYENPGIGFSQLKQAYGHVDMTIEVVDGWTGGSRMARRSAEIWYVKNDKFSSTSVIKLIVVSTALPPVVRN